MPKTLKPKIFKVTCKTINDDKNNFVVRFKNLGKDEKNNFELNSKIL